uniref:ATP synthase complex subunit 8 n=1 Tax=Allopsontus sp. 1 JZ-2014 TaxID=1529456 RepID=A0A0B4N5W5_9INSE|nr:ATP synthase subunit 8 [Allopsontus sp. 1 JZ-2014]
MPQMSPLNWLMLFTLFTMFYIIFLTFNYFHTPLIKQEISTNSTLASKSLNWKW